MAFVRMIIVTDIKYDIWNWIYRFFRFFISLIWVFIEGLVIICSLSLLSFYNSNFGSLFSNILIYSNYFYFLSREPFLSLNNMKRVFATATVNSSHIREDDERNLIELKNMNVEFIFIAILFKAKYVGGEMKFCVFLRCSVREDKIEKFVNGNERSCEGKWQENPILMCSYQ